MNPTSILDEPIETLRGLENVRLCRKRDDAHVGRRHMPRSRVSRSRSRQLDPLKE